MRIQIVKQRFANEDVNYFLKEKLPLGWRKIYKPYPFSDDVEYHPTLESAMTRVQELIKDHLANSVVDVEVVYDTGEIK